MSKQTIKWSQFVAENLSAGKAKSRKVIGDNNMEITAWTIPLVYKYPNGQSGDLVVNYPDLVSGFGISPKVMKTYTKFQVTGTIVLSDEENQKFYDNFVQPYNERILQLLVDNYETMYGKDPKMKDKEKETMYRFMIEKKYMSTFFQPINKDTQEVIEGRDPISVLVLMNFDNVKTIFTDVEKNKLINPDTNKPCTFEESVELLTGIGFTFRPMVSFRSINCDNWCRSASTIRSAIVYNLTEGNEESAQDEDSEELMQKLGSAAVDELNTKLLALKKLKASKPAANPLTDTTVVYQSGKKPPAPKRVVHPKSDDDNDFGNDDDTNNNTNNNDNDESGMDTTTTNDDNTENTDDTDKQQDTPPPLPTFVIPKRTTTASKGIKKEK